MTADKKLGAKVIAGDRRALAQAITLLESQNATDVPLANNLLDELYQNAIGGLRIGISGPPGVGKSSFIEAFGQHLIQDKKLKVAVLAIDPSSPISGGSILGDRTRMPLLSANPSAFIRPSPSGDSLGGVAAKSRQAVIACQAAGFDVVIVETVGIGQSEIAVASMVDSYVVLQLPNSGDDLQGVKRGVLELADIVAVTKADGPTLDAAKLAKETLESVLHLFRNPTPPVLLTSSVAGTGIAEMWHALQTTLDAGKKSGAFAERRQAQLVECFKAELREQLLAKLMKKNHAAQLVEIEKDVRAGNVFPLVAARRLVERLTTSS
jgi:LAO/AO transport system kinase